MQSYHLAATIPALCTAWMGRHPVFAGGITPPLPEAPKRNDNPKVSSHTLLLLCVGFEQRQNMHLCKGNNHRSSLSAALTYCPTLIQNDRLGKASVWFEAYSKGIY